MNHLFRCLDAVVRRASMVSFLQMQVKNDTAPAEFTLRNVTSIPEPTSLALSLLGAVLLAGRRASRRRGA